MPKKRTVNLSFPVGGLHKSSSYQAQPPYTTPSCLNVRPRDVVEGRGRGGSRPGMGKALYNVHGSGNPVRMLNTVGYISSKGITQWSDSFGGTTLAYWQDPPAAWSSSTRPTILPADYADVTYGNTGIAWRAATAATPTNFNTPTAAYEIGIYISPYAGAHHGTYTIYGRLNNTTPVPARDGFAASLTITGTDGAFSGSIVFTNGNGSTDASPTTVAFTSGTHNVPLAGWFLISVTPGSPDTITGSWCGTSLFSTTFTYAAAAAHSYGFGMNCTVAGGICLVDEFRLQYVPTDNAQTMTRAVIVSSNGSIYKAAQQNTSTIVSTSATLASDRYIQASERSQKLYIADSGAPKAISDTTSGAGSLGVVAAGVLDEDAGSAAAWKDNWNSLSLAVLDDMVTIYDTVGGTGGFTDGTYKITSVHNTNGATLTGVTGSCTSCNYRIQRGPKVYDPVANTLVLMTATAGFLPVGCPLICTYRDRIVLGGDARAPHVWYMCRAGSAGADWDYSVASTDGARAVAGTSTDSGQIADPLTALAPHSDDYLIMGCDQSLWVMRGDPAYGGSITNLSRIVGVVGKKAWCFGPTGEFVFLSRDGIYALAAGAGGYPVSISRERLPNELRDVDSVQYEPLLGYDFKERGVHIYLSPKTAGTQEYHWFLDWQTKGFWPMQVPATHDPMAICEVMGATGGMSGLLMGCRDGYVRRMDERDQITDDGTAITSNVMIGPLSLGDGYRDGIANEVIGVLGSSSGGVTATLQVGAAGEAAVNASTFSTATWSAGYNYTWRPRGRGQAAVIKLANAATLPWAFESATLLNERLGKQRKV